MTRSLLALAASFAYLFANVDALPNPLPNRPARDGDYTRDHPKGGWGPRPGDYSRSPGCGKALAAGLKQGGTGDSNNITIYTTPGTARTFLLHIPETYDPNNAHGMIFSFAGRTRTDTQQEDLSQFSNPEFNPNMIAVYPQGIDNQWQGDPAATTDDVSFTLDMIANLTQEYCIDENKIFVAGKSNGGGFAANILACHPIASTKIAAFASASGAYYQDDAADGSCNAETTPIKCNPGRQGVPVLETHGTADTTIPYNGGDRRGKCLPSVPHFMTAWADRNGFGTTNTSTSLYDGNVIKYEWGNGVNTHYEVIGLGHQWPSTMSNGDGGPTYFNATPIMMDFFNNNPLKSEGSSYRYSWWGNWYRNWNNRVGGSKGHWSG